MKINHLFWILIFSFAAVSCTTKSSQIEGKYKTEGLNWLSMNQIEAVVKSDPKPIIVDVYTSWCGPCKMLDRNTFSDPKIQQIFKENFHIVKFNAEGNDEYTFQGKKYANPGFKPNKRGRNAKNELASFFGVRGYPTLAIYDAQFKPIGKLVGYRDAVELEGDLQQYIKKQEN